MNQPILVATTTDSSSVAEKLTRQLVEERLVACGQIEGPIQAIYRWQGKLEQASEYRCVFKTDRRLWSKLVHRIQELHNYDVPEIIGTDLTDITNSYSEWMQAQLGPGDTS